MCIDEGNLWITFNGEIYNYIEIRKELQDKGCIFKSESDTEVVLFAYKVWGKKCLQKFNGMWAFVIFDKTKNILFGARDRFGVKPFYYYKDKDVFAFASEQKALVKMPFIQTGIRQEAVYDYFVKGEIEYETLSFFKHINELFPAHSFELHVNTGNFNVDRYYVLETNARYESYEEEKFIVAKDRVAELLNNAVKLRLRADVSVGACLSGGIDSSAIVSLMDNLNKESGVKEKINLFTASFNDITVDESPFAARVAEQTNSAFYRVFPNSDELVSDLENLIYCQDVPIWSTSTYAQYRVMQKAKEAGVKVVLDGQGGDELFCGYHSYMYNYWAEILKQFKLGKLHSEMKGFLPWHLRYSFFAKQHLRFSTIRRLPAFVQYQINRNYFGDLYYFNSQFLNENKNRLQSEPVPKNLNKMLMQEFTNTRLKAYLKCEDRCSMWHSVESRTPFADDINLIEYAFQLPSSYKIKNFVSNYGVGNYGLDQSFLKYKVTKIKKETKIVIFGFVPETICRIQSCWKYYLEFGNIHGFKPFCFIKNNKIIIHNNILKKNTKFTNLKNVITRSKNLDRFYYEKYNKYVFRNSYFFCFMKNFFYNINIIYIYIKFLVRNKNKKNNEILEDNIFPVVMKKNITTSHLLYLEKYS
jgi:asparagine synthase (glutamine-hydrolysing)